MGIVQVPPEGRRVKIGFPIPWPFPPPSPPFCPVIIHPFVVSLWRGKSAKYNMDKGQQLKRRKRVSLPSPLSANLFPRKIVKKIGFIRP